MDNERGKKCECVGYLFTNQKRKFNQIENDQNKKFPGKDL